MIERDRERERHKGGMHLPSLSYVGTLFTLITYKGVRLSFRSGSLKTL
jgi:hypothetical protein